MRLREKQRGFSAIEIVIVLAVIALLGFLGYIFINRQNSDTATQNTTQQSEASDVSSAPQIRSREDLDTAVKVLDENDPAKSNDDTAQLDSDLSQF